MKNVIVLGASPNENRYSFLAVKMLCEYGHSVTAIGKNNGFIEKTPVKWELPILENIHTISIYLNSEIQKQYFDKILKIKPLRVIFNPGTENDELENLCRQNNIAVIEGCTLVMLRTNQF